MDIVEDHDDRGVLHGEAGHQPVEAVADALWIGCAAVARDHQADRGRDDLVPAAEDPAVLVLAALREHRLEELAHHMEGRALFVLAAAGPEHGAAAGGGPSARLAEHRGLAGAAGPLEGDHSAAAGLGPVSGIRTAQFGQRGVHRAQLPLPLQQCPTRPVLLAHVLRHVASPPAGDAERSADGTLRSSPMGGFPPGIASGTRQFTTSSIDATFRTRG
ncbi:hypothetical protein M271_43395 [Streptomyces rapamycinicus NRRL 5491]|nr:hypothetical protein M271_43395 [Streptomyces rapamycinicus NRRL 5491]